MPSLSFSQDAAEEGTSMIDRKRAELGSCGHEHIMTLTPGIGFNGPIPLELADFEFEKDQSLQFRAMEWKALKHEASYGGCIYRFSLGEDNGFMLVVAGEIVATVSSGQTE